MKICLPDYSSNPSTAVVMSCIMYWHMVAVVMVTLGDCCILAANSYFIVVSFHYIALLCSLPQEVQGFKNVSEMERFMLEHGDRVVDVLGSEVDRIELKIKARLNYMHFVFFCCFCS